jgi:hypothetical protein
MGLLNLLDITAGINKGIEGAMQAGWKPMRNFYEGLRGTTKYKDAEGEIVSMSPAQKLARRLKNDTKQMFTGNRYDMKNNLVEEELGVGGRIGNAVTGGLHFVGDATLGTAGTALGWSARMAGKGVWWGAKTMHRVGAGKLLTTGINAVGDTAMGAADLVLALNKGPVGKNVLLGLGVAGAAGIGGAGALGEEFGGTTTMANSLKFYSGGSIESVPGEISPSGQRVDDSGNLVQPTNGKPIDNMGADGSLVFALHNMR